MSIPMKYKSAVAILAMAMTGVSYAGDEVISNAKQADVPVVEERDWCDLFELLGTPIYSSPDNPFLQEIKFYGRAQYQWGYTDGDYAGSDFDANGDEWRRLRVGAQIKFLNNFKLKGNVNLSKGFRNPEFGYESFDELYLAYTLGEFAGFEDVTVGYGRRKVAVGSEVHTSSKKIKTVERSNIANHYYPGRSTGVTLGAKRGGVKWSAGVFSTDGDESIGQWEGGEAYYLSAGFEAANGDWTVDFVYNDADSSQDDTFGYEWAASVAYETEMAGWEVMANVLYGEEHSGDATYGFVLMPSRYLIEDTLELVFRYQYAGSDGDNIGVSKRNVRNALKHDLGVKSFYGEENHTIYGGLNWYLCGNNAKIMTGLEYETLEDSMGYDLDALTFWAAFRTYF